MDNEFYSNIAFPWILFDHVGSLIQKGDGTLFEISLGALSDKNIGFLKNIKTEGWCVDALGWAIYSKVVSEGILILPGLKVHGISKVSGKSETLQMKLLPSVIEEHVSRIISLANFARDSSGSHIRSLIHEIRTANAAIKNAAYELNNAESDERLKNDLSGNILALSEILSARLDAQDIISAYASVETRPRDKIHIYKKFDKLIRSYTPTARQKRIRLELQGSSDDYTRGPDIFEIVPFLLIENAIKYAPENSTITCRITKRNYNNLLCCVESFGPRIESDEINKIFEAGYRGRHAKLSKAGDGLGLSVLKTAVELYGGNVYVQPAIDSIPVNDNSYYFNRFFCSFPIEFGNKSSRIPGISMR